MTTLLFANDASTTLQSGISAGATTATLAAGSGSLFPNPTAGQAYYMTLLDASTQQVKEIVLVLNRMGDTISIVRGQQNTFARTWNAGDFAVQLVTAGDMGSQVQPDQLQESEFTVAQGAGTNSITATLTSGLTSLPAVMQFTIIAAGANTGNVTLTMTLGLTLQPSYPLLKFGGSQLNAGDIPSADFPIEVTWVAALGYFIMTNPASSSAGSIAGGAANDLLVQTAPGTTGFITAPSIAGQVLAFVGGVIQWVAAAVTSFNGRSGAVVPQTGDYTATQVGAVPLSAFQAPNKQNGNPMYDVLPSGNIYQSGNRANSGVSTNVTFPYMFPNACTSVVVSCNNQAAAIRVTLIDRASFQYQCGGTVISWQATGW